MKSIMFVCHGNICRSPMAEMILKSILKDRRLDKKYRVDSCATSFEEIGNPIYPPARKILIDNGIQIENHYAKRLTKADYNNFDYLICMDRMNVRNAKLIVDGDDKNKIVLFKELCGCGSLDVSDPWYSDNFGLCFEELFKLCHYLVDFLEQ